MPQKLTLAAQKQLLEIAREALMLAVNGKQVPSLNLADLPDELQVPGASFVTLTIGGDLRGCIGSLEAWRPLAQDVQAHALDAALRDPRFRPVQPSELPLIHIEVSYLTPQTALEYTDPKQLPHLLRPGIDGVVLGLGSKRATFLPQVWEQLPDPAQFLNHLCQKAGLPAEIWRKELLDISLYQVQDFQENSAEPE
jgi:AmmeMemoRadiSam system protein A